MKTINLKCGYCDTNYNSFGSCACMFAKEELLQKLKELRSLGNSNTMPDIAYHHGWAMALDELKEFLNRGKK